MDSSKSAPTPAFAPAGRILKKIDNQEAYIGVVKGALEDYEKYREKAGVPEEALSILERLALCSQFILSVMEAEKDLD